MGFTAADRSTKPIEQVGIGEARQGRPSTDRYQPGLRRLFVIPAVLLLAFVAAPSADARPARDIAAVALHPWQLQNSQTRERVFAGIEASGVRWVRVDMPWNWVEEHGPTLRNGHGNWNALDAVVQAADRHHLKIIGILGFTPSWASDTGEMWAFPRAQPFEYFFATALRRYPQIPAWELWNEPNFERFAKPRPDPAGFVEFLRSARRARDSVGSSAKLISGGIAPGGAIDIVPWVNEMALRGGLELIDGLGVHPYGPAEPDDPRAWMMQLEALHDRLADFGRPDLPLWLTEFGAPTVSVANGYAPALSEDQQAERLRIAFALATRFDWIHNLTWYEYRDGCTGSHDPECNFGLVHTDLSPKPAYAAMREVIAGATAKLRPRLFLATRITQARVPVARAAKRPKRRGARRRASKRVTVKRRTVNRIVVSGKLTLPGTSWPNAVITVLLPRRGAPPRSVPVVVKEGYFWARFEGPALRSGTLEARYGGSDAYQPLRAQIQVASSVTTSR
jgi:polysaccharide biosynthesis protein PslG